MKFPRNARIFRGQLDAAPFMAVLFLLVMFLMLGTLVYTPGVHIRLPAAQGLAGTDKRSETVAIDANGQFYYENRAIGENELQTRLARVVKNSAEPLALIVRADEGVSWKMMSRVNALAQSAGFAEAIWATMPRALTTPAEHSR